MRPIFRYNLQARYSVQILMVIIVSAVCISMLSVWELYSAAEKVENVTSLSLETHLEAQLRERGRVISDFLAADLVNAVVRYDMLAMRDQLQSTIEQQDVVFALVYDARGKVIHDGSNQDVGFGLSVDEILGWPATGGGQTKLHLSGDVLHVIRPIRFGIETVGGVALGLSLDQVGTEIQQLRLSLGDLTENSLRRELQVAGLFTLLFLIAGTVFALLSGRRLARPIRQLALFARQVGQGNFHSKLEISRNDEVGDLANAFQTMSRDLHASNREIQFLAYHDPLTGLPNRALLKESITRLCSESRASNKKAAVLFIDLDDFKPVNDTLGHDAGDALLRTAAQRLKSCLSEAPAKRWRFAASEQQSVARIGGDEFTVMLQNIDSRHDAGDVAEKIVARLCQPFTVGGHEVSIGASIGIATFPDDGEDHESLLAHADVAMYNAKRLGKHAFCHYQSNMLEQTRERLFMINDLRKALDNEGFDVHYQPIVSGTNGSVAGVEALVRWQHPERGLINAAEFIEAAEKSGDIERLGHWVIERVCADLAGWRKQGVEGLFASVNVSSRQLLRTDLSDLLGGLLARYQLTARDLVIEASETRLSQNLGDDKVVLNDLRQAGFDIWVDQFGLGEASLLSLRNSPARGIKLSPAFIENISDNPRARQYIAAVLTMARSLDLETCAVGVSNKTQSEWLRKHGCTYLQGYFMGEEILAADMAGYLDVNVGQRPADQGYLQAL